MNPCPECGRYADWDECPVHGATALDLVFAGEGPDLKFVEAEVDGKSVRAGEWRAEDGFQILRIQALSVSKWLSDYTKEET